MFNSGSKTSISRELVSRGIRQCSLFHRVTFDSSGHSLQTWWYHSGLSASRHEQPGSYLVETDAFAWVRGLRRPWLWPVWATTVDAITVTTWKKYIFLPNTDFFFVWWKINIQFLTSFVHVLRAKYPKTNRSAFCEFFVVEFPEKSLIDEEIPGSLVESHVRPLVLPH